MFVNKQSFHIHSGNYNFVVKKKAMTSNIEKFLIHFLVDKASIIENNELHQWIQNSKNKARSKKGILKFSTSIIDATKEHIKKTRDTRILKKSNYGMDYGWDIEFENHLIGELKHCADAPHHWGETFEIISASKENDTYLLKNGLWSHSKFKFRNKKYNSHLVTPFVCGSGIKKRNGKKYINIKYLAVSRI